MKLFTPSYILIEQSVKSHPETQTILSRLPGIPRTVIPKLSDIPPSTHNRTLILAEQKGASCVPCPGTPQYLCCQYHILDIGIGCPIHCTYCFLHQYRNNKGIIVYVNIQKALESLTDPTAKTPRAIIRIGTGEFTDSLFLDHITHFSKKIVSYFAQTQHVIELKTKTDNIKNLIGLDHREHTVIGWSLNPESIIKTEEIGAASLIKRLRSAKICQQEGYPVAFHFDPIIYSARWESLYRRIVEMLAQHIDPNRCVWISLGTLRFNPGMKSIIQENFPRSSIIYEEMINGIDGKLRYLQPLRIKIYRTMHQWLKKYFIKTPIYLCMESQTVWKRSLGFAPKNSNDFESYIVSRWEKIKKY